MASAEAVWEKAYADAEAWPRWNAELKRASLDGPLALGASARIVFTTGLRLRFRVVEFEQGRLLTDEARLPGARRAAGGADADAQRAIAELARSEPRLS